jgi:hypothetical protein
MLSSVDCITTTSESEFSVHTTKVVARVAAKIDRTNSLLYIFAFLLLHAGHEIRHNSQQTQQ